MKCLSINLLRIEEKRASFYSDFLWSQTDSLHECLPVQNEPFSNDTFLAVAFRFIRIKMMCLHPFFPFFSMQGIPWNFDAYFLYAALCDNDQWLN